MVSTTAAVHADERPARSRPPVPARGRLWIPLSTCLLVAAMAQLPLLRDRWAYFTDDAATQVLPMWFRMGEQVRAGQWPPMLELDSWMGGNLAVETLFGIWNPINAVVWVFVSFMPDLAVAGSLIRTFAFVAVALGCYLLCREYGAARWASSVLAAALPFCGPLFYYDAVRWPCALLAFVWIPFLWWAARRATHDRMNVIWVFVFGGLAVTSGNPYATLGACIVLAAMLVECLVSGRAHAGRRLFLVSLTIAALTPLVYLPLLLSRQVTWRMASELGNSGFMAPSLGDLVNLSSPNYTPEITGIGEPAIFFCWFALPLAAWLDWGTLRSRAKNLAGCLTVTGIFLLFAIGPAEVWMFRWPLRVLHYGYLALAVLLAVLLTAGLRMDRFRRRVFSTAVLLAFACYLGFAAVPSREVMYRYTIAMLIIGLLTSCVVLMYRSGRSPAVLLHLGTVMAFALQVVWFMAPNTPTSYYFPPSVQQAREHFQDRYNGTAIQIGDTGLLGEPVLDRPAWQDLQFGNLFLPTGVEAINSYTSMGMAAFSDQLCFSYHGSTCAEAYAALWKRPPGVDVPLADLLRLNTVVVQPRLVEHFQVPQGWRVQDRNERVTVLRRDPGRDWHDGRLSWASSGTRVTGNAAPDDRHEKVRFERSGGSGRLVFARLAWPGYSAEVNGVRIPAYAGPSGLLEVRLPPGVEQGELRLTWTPPRLKASGTLALVGVLGAAGLGTAHALRRRRSGSG